VVETEIDIDDQNGRREDEKKKDFLSTKKIKKWNEKDDKK